METLTAAGLPATCNHGGAGKWYPELIRWFRDRHVVILPDHDEAGRVHAGLVATSLKPVATSVKVLRLPGLPEKGDVSDWLPGHSVSELMALSTAQAEYSFGEGEVVEEAEQLPVICFSGTLPAPPTWLVGGLLVEGTCCVIGGAPKAYKSFIAEDIAMAVATEGEILGQWRARRRGKPLIYSPEGGIPALERRLWGLCHGHEYDPHDILPRIPVIDARVSLSRPDEYLRLRRTVEVEDPDLLILDPLISCHTADENSADEMQEVLGLIRGLLSPRMVIVVVHHIGKATDGRSLGYALRGSSAIEAWRDTLVSVRLVNEESGVRRVDVSHRDAPSPDPVGFSLEFFHVPGSTPEVPGLRLRYENLTLENGQNARIDPVIMESVRKSIVNCSANWLRSEIADANNIPRNTFNKYFTILEKLGIVELVEKKYPKIVDRE